MNTVNSIMVLVSLIFVASSASACFITNCPPGGKRSVGAPGPQRECLPCGSDGRGRCFGPDICCTPEGGCHFKTRDTLVCRLEALNPHLCKVPGPTCGPDGRGNCGSEGLCCTAEGCMTDKTCVPRREMMDNFEGFNVL